MAADSKYWWRLLSFSYLSFLCCWLVGSVYLLFKLYASGEMFYFERDGVFHFVDFTLFYMGGQLALSEQRHLIYDRQVELEFFNRLIAPSQIARFPFVEYPPLFFLIMALFAAFPIKPAYILWSVMSLAALLIGASLFLRRRSELSKVDKRLFLLGSLVFLPTWLNFLWGQTGLLLLGLICAYFWSFLRRRDIAAGAALALTTFKLQYVFLLVVPALAFRRWKLVASFAVVELLLLVLAGLIVGWENVLGYPRVLLQVETSSDYYGVFIEKMSNLRGLLSLFLPRPAVSVISISGFVLGIAGCYCLWRRALRSSSDRKESVSPVDWAIALTLVICLLTGLHSHYQDCVFLVLAAALTLPTLNPAAAVKLSPVSLRLWTLTILLSPFVCCCLYVYYDIGQKWHVASVNPFVVIDSILLLSGLSYFRSLTKSR
jgi:hypothetical protein